MYILYVSEGKIECLNRSKVAVILSSHQKICGEPINNYFSIYKRGNDSSYKQHNPFSEIEIGQ